MRILLSLRSITHWTEESALYQIKHHSEELVADIMHDYASNLTEEQLLDATCIALNKLPCRYYRCPISMSHHISIESDKTDSELTQINQDVENSIRAASLKILEIDMSQLEK